MNGDKNSLELLKNKNYVRINWLRQRSDLLKIIDGVDYVIIDSYLAPSSFYEDISRLSGRLISIDDFKRLTYPKGMVLNLSIYGGQLNYVRRKGVVYLWGKDYVILRKEFWHIHKKIIKKNAKDILITFGGVSHINLTNRIVSFLGKEYNLRFKLVDSAKKKISARDMLKLMLKADICISGGGQTAYELARVGVPAIGVCCAKSQILNLKALAKAGTLEFAGWYNEANLLTRIEKALIKTLDYDTRIKMSRIGRKIVDGNGARRVIDRILNKS